MFDSVMLAAGVLAFTLLMYVLLDGTDLGVGMLLAFFPETQERHKLIATILPVWDANETWLVLLGGGMLALFPAAYGTLLTGFYPWIIIMLLALIFRAVGIEYRRDASVKVKFLLDRVCITASAIVAFIQGLLAGSIVAGKPLDSVLAVFSPFSVLFGAATIAGYLLLGCCWVHWRTEGQPARQACRLAVPFLALTVLLVIALLLLQQQRFPTIMALPGARLMLAAGTLFALLVPLALRSQVRLLPLVAALLMVTSLIALTLRTVYPWLIPDVLSLQDAAAPEATRAFVLGGTALAIPITLIYNSWAFWVLRGKVS